MPIDCAVLAIQRTVLPIDLECSTCAPAATDTTYSIDWHTPPPVQHPGHYAESKGRPEDLLTLPNSVVS